MASGIRLLADLEGQHQDRVWAAAWSPDGSLLASCSGDRTVRIWRPQGPQQQPGGDAQQQCAAWAAASCAAVLEDGHSRTVRALSWAPGGRQLAVASFDATTTIWARTGADGGAAGWEQVAILEGHENEVKGVAWSPDGCHVATCGRDKSVWVWEALPGHEFECVDVKQGHTQDVKALAWHPSGEQLVSASYDDTIRCWAPDGDEWACTQTLAGTGQGGMGHDSTVWAVAFNGPGTGLASCSDDRTVKVWAAATGSQRTRPTWKHAVTLSGYHSRPIYSLDWSKTEAPGPGRITTGDGENCIHVFAAAESSSDGAVPMSWRLSAMRAAAHDSDVNCVRWHPTVPGLLASCGDDARVRLWYVPPDM